MHHLKLKLCFFSWFYSETLRALYISDNDFETVPEDIGQLGKLEVVSIVFHPLKSDHTRLVTATLLSL